MQHWHMQAQMQYRSVDESSGGGVTSSLRVALQLDVLGERKCTSDVEDDHVSILGHMPNCASSARCVSTTRFVNSVGTQYVAS